ncbi:MAG: sensor histidine kinase [archaeon]|nr:sensor histidine kinase [archaeon]
MTPVSLILNELITNSLKYAFKDEDENKTISIRFKVKNNKDVELIFKDNGIGLPEGFDMASTSGIGFIVINSLVSQLDGEISTIDCDGTGFKIEFKLLD